MISNAAKTLQDLADFKKKATDSMETKEIVSFNVGSINVENEKLLVEGVELTENSTKKILSYLRVKNNFLALSKSMGPLDWNTINEKLKRVHADQVVHGRKILQEGKTYIEDVHIAAPKTDGIIDVGAIFDEITQAISGTGKDIALRSTHLLEDKDEIVVTLIDHDSPLDPFFNGTDLWKVGKRITWNGLQFSVIPYFERVLTESGSTTSRGGFRSNISNNKFKLDKIKKILENEIALDADAQRENLVDAINHLKHNRVSVREFQKYKNLFDEEEHTEILEKWFDDKEINKAFGCIVSEMPAMWQATADTGKNAYDFFCDLIYIASHPEETKLSPRECVDLQAKISDLLLKNELDIELLAPKVEWK